VPAAPLLAATPPGLAAVHDARRPQPRKAPPAADVRCGIPLAHARRVARRCRRQALPILCALVALPGAARAAGRTPCPASALRFLADPGTTSLLAATRTSTRDALVLDGTAVTVQSSTGDCGPAQAKLRRAKGVVLIHVRWGTCPGVTGPVRLTARIVNGCTLLKGTLRVGRQRPRRFRAARSTCGDRYVDAAAGEQCEPPSTAICDAFCHLIGSPDVRQCPPSQVSCSGLCVDPRSDAANCGACGRACPGAPNAAPRCVAGACQVACRRGFADCDGNPANGCETDLTSDVAHCGTCDSACPAFPNASPACSGGRCTSTCAPGFGDCDGNPANGCETDLTSDAAHCGKCTLACLGTSTTTATCQGGTCQYACTNPGPGQVICGKSCVDPSTDKRNCGGCGNLCPSNEVCVDGTCTCPSPEQLCARTCTDLTSDPTNCGQCGRACPQRADSCVNGTCVCLAPNKVCSGVCTDLQTDTKNCGRCGTVCAPGFQCTLGKCVCPQGQDVCSGRCVDTNTDAKNCGHCGTICAPGFTCSAGHCICAQGLDVCDGRCTNLDTDRNNCGRCGTKCAALEVCQGGACTCPSAYEVCRGVCVNPQSDPANCGGCNRVCPAGKTCVQGHCQ
jgi:hypothetical protein